MYNDISCHVLSQELWIYIFPSHFTHKESRNIEVLVVESNLNFHKISYKT